MAHMQPTADIVELYPPEFDTFSPETQRKVIQYLQSLTPIQRKAYNIAREKLGTSFDILRCNGFATYHS